MIEVIEFAFSAVNFLPTFLFIIIILYWICVILGALDMGFLDFDLESDFETDVMIDVEIEADFNTDTNVGGSSWFQAFLSFFNLGKVPFMVFMSFLTIPLWGMCITINYYLGVESFGFAFAIFSACFVLCMFISKFCTWPLVGFFRKLEDDSLGDEDLIGRICYAKTMIDDVMKGQIEIFHEGISFSVYAVTRKGKTIKKGDKGLVIEFNKENNVYYIEPENEL